MEYLCDAILADVKSGQAKGKIQRAMKILRMI